MATKNRAALINKALKVVRKHFKPATPAKDRSLLEHLLYACLLENSTHEAADKAFTALTGEYFDWNEVRVSTIRELAEVLKPLSDPAESATRLKRILQSVFETHYSFDLEALKKQNIGVAVKQIEKYNGSTPFVVAFVTSQALGGHAIPVSAGLLESLRIVGVVTPQEAAKGLVPGLERAVPKSKGAEAASVLHQLGVEMHKSPYGPKIKQLLLEIEPAAKDDLPKRPAKADEEAKAAVAAAAKAAAAKSVKAPESPKKPEAKKGDAKKPAPAADAKKPAAQKPEPPKKPEAAKKPTPKKPAVVAKKKPSAAKKITKKKPR